MNQNSSNINSYLGQKGYTLPKNELSAEQQLQIRNDLTIKPYVSGAPVSTKITFPAYRESDKKFYVPHYYGVEKFGSPKKVSINEGTNINVEFNGKLRDYQEPVANKFIDHCLHSKYGCGGGLLELYCAWGKTSTSLYIACQLKKKLLVIVHKEFLMNQWIERIQQFIPKARIGKIQGQIIDIDDKDIVICMLQSLSMKEYPASVFESFGFTIIDEVHHISSETFSNALFKVVTKYMLGLSATMNRKDGTTHVFKMFLGNVVHKAERKDEHKVNVHAVTFETDDYDFNEIVYDFRGNPQFSTMISKLCCHNPRTEFIIQLLNDFICVDNIDKNIISEHKKKMDSEVPPCLLCGKNENYLIKNTCCNIVKYCLPCMQKMERDTDKNMDSSTTRKTKNVAKCPYCSKKLKYEQNYMENIYVKPLTERHTIILSHNLNVLDYIYNRIVCKNYASVGYYVGGMKEAQLKESEKKQVVLATFSMAAEALDIPTLNAEFLITPKTDIEQAVGRILRAKHATSHPVIYDIVDTHEIFQKQFLKRKAFYKKQNYKIIETTSANYMIDPASWETTYDGNKSVKKSKKNNKNNKNNTAYSNKSLTSDTEEDSNNEDDVQEEIHDPELKEIQSLFKPEKIKSKDDILCGKCFLKIKNKKFHK